ncbi:MAG: FtsX-like permease family protein, partial [Blastocatellia bacterium]
DEATAKQFLQGLDPIGAHITIDDLGTRGRELEIVGITGNVKNFSLEESPLPTIYFPFYQIPDNQVAAVTGRLHLVLRSKSDPLGLGMAVRQAVQSVDNEIPASYVKSMDQYLSAAVSPRRFNLFLLSIFAVLALLLAALGVYAVVSYWVSQRTNEIGIRLALGASRGDILRLMTGAAIKPVLLGLGFGLAVALSLTSVMSGLLFEVKSTDLVTYVLVSTMLVFVALLATYIPSRRSTKVDPATVLRLG